MGIARKQLQRHCDKLRQLSVNCFLRQRVPTKTTGSWVTKRIETGRALASLFSLKQTLFSLTLQKCAIQSKNCHPKRHIDAHNKHFQADDRLFRVKRSCQSNWKRPNNRGLENDEYSEVAGNKIKLSSLAITRRTKLSLDVAFCSDNAAVYGSPTRKDNYWVWTLPPVIKHKCTVCQAPQLIQSASLPVSRERRRCRSPLRVSQHRAVIFRFRLAAVGLSIRRP